MHELSELIFRLFDRVDDAIYPCDPMVAPNHPCHNRVLQSADSLKGSESCTQLYYRVFHWFPSMASMVMHTHTVYPPIFEEVTYLVDSSHISLSHAMP